MKAVPKVPPRIQCATLNHDAVIRDICSDSSQPLERFAELATAFSVAKLIVRELSSAAGFWSEDALQLVLLIAADCDAILPEARSSILRLQNLHLEAEQNSDDRFTSEAWRLLFGRALSTPPASDVCQQSSGITPEVISHNIALVEFVPPTNTSRGSDGACDLGTRLIVQGQYVAADALVRRSLVCMACVCGAWVVVFPVVRGDSRRLVVLAVTTSSGGVNFRASRELRALRDACFCETSDFDTDPDKDDGEAFLEKILSALVLGFVIATLIKVVLFFLRCNEHWKPRCKPMMPLNTCHRQLSWTDQAQDLALCFVFGPSA